MALAARSLLDDVHAALKAEVTKIGVALPSMNFWMFAMESPMLTAGWDEEAK